jgi:hypothetical protein
MQPRPVNSVRLALEVLEDRTVPASLQVTTGAFEPTYQGGLLLVAPPADKAHSHAGEIRHQLANVTLPSGNVFPAHGVKLADTHSPAVNWTPT